MRVLLFCGGAALSALAVWVIDSRPLTSACTAPILPVLLLAALPLAAGVYLSHYLSRLGYCCETSFAFFFGFPFSFLVGMAGYEPEILTFMNLTIQEIIQQPELQVSLTVYPGKLFLSALFWVNLIFVLWSMIRRIVQRGKAAFRE